MPAYLKNLIPPLCEWGNCRVNATRQLFNSRNAPCGFYCIRHAAAAISHYVEKYETP